MSRLQTTSGRGAVLRQVAEGVLSHQSEFCQSNAVVVRGRAGVLIIDAGIHDSEMACLANDLSDAGQTVVAGFSTHPHWDHVLWHARFGSAPRYGTARCAAAIRDQLSGPHWKDSIAGWIPPDIAEHISWDLFGLITGLPAETARIPWDGPQVRIVEHQAHAAGHAALLIEERGVLVAGDMLSDGPSAELIRYAPGSARIARTCRPCVTPVLLTTRGSAHRHRSIGCPACMNGNYSSSPEGASATGHGVAVMAALARVYR
jgi:glyoxylase-like metal-dependent hydrolase (beta-lactamase superfamily II)